MILADVDKTKASLRLHFMSFTCGDASEQNVPAYTEKCSVSLRFTFPFPSHTTQRTFPARASCYILFPMNT